MIRIERLYESLATSTAGPGGPRLVARAADLAARQAPLDVETTNDQVLAWLGAHQEVEALAVVADGVPIGLINRHLFMEAYAKPFAREVFGRRSCIAWMDKQPLVVDAALPLEALVQQAVATGAKALKDGFVVTEQGRYAGLGSGFALLEAMSALEQEKTRRLLDSIEYASQIQRAYLSASDEQLAAAPLDPALVWEPRDVVGGDCYFVRRLEGGTFAALLDCTGHGVPGAFMTLIALSWLEQAFQGPGAPHQPGEALAGLSGYLKRVLGQTAVEAREDGATRGSDDGLDAACLWLPDGAGHLDFAGARLPLLVVRPGDEPEVVEGDRVSVGYLDTPADQRWTTRRVERPAGTLLAVATDGVTDQLGGPKRLAHGRRRLLELLGEHRQERPPALAERFREAFRGWQGAEPRRDDVALLLLRPWSAA